MLSAFACPPSLLAAVVVMSAPGGPARAAHFTESPGGSPLTIWIGENGWFQELVAGNTDYSFFPPSQPQTSDVSADAGFVLAFPSTPGLEPPTDRSRARSGDGRLPRAPTA